MAKQQKQAALLRREQSAKKQQIRRQTSITAFRAGDKIYFVLFFVLYAMSGFAAEKGDFKDAPFTQEYSIKYELDDSTVVLVNAVADRNGYIQLFSSQGLLTPNAGQFLFPGSLVPDRHYQPTSDKNIAALTSYEDQLIYLDDQAVFSNAWAGRLFLKHGLPDANLLCAGTNFSFLVSNGRDLRLLVDAEISWSGQAKEPIRQIVFSEAKQAFFLLGDTQLYSLSLAQPKIKSMYKAAGMTCMASQGTKLWVGTENGYFIFDLESQKADGPIHRNLPSNHITTIAVLDDQTWFGSSAGAYRLNDDGSFKYYASRRWLLGDHVLSITGGPENSILILTSNGLSQLCREEMTLADKAALFEKQVRKRHIRHGFNATLGHLTNGDLSSGSLVDSDNDGLWTSMYLAAEAFRYSVTNSPEALQNIRESMDAMDRLFSINPVDGFPSRSFERRGYKFDDEPWRRADHPEWDWKSTSSSDEAIGHLFAYGVIAELVDEPELNSLAISLIDTLMSHVLEHDYYLVDWDGKPTLWGRWNPEYVNSFPVNVGDRKINSSNIIAMLQTAYHFTRKEKYRTAAFDLMQNHGYYENLMRPMKEIGFAPDDAGDWAKMLSEGWNHSDDEMYFCGYWGLYRYALNDTLKSNFKTAIVDHWEVERPEKDALWNLMTGLVGRADYDYEEAIWFLQQYPLDLIDWTVRNSERRDIDFIADNFRGQTIAEVLPPDELPIGRHNRNRFVLDQTNGGRREYSAGDIWLLPYWMGRFLGIIHEPN